MRDPGHPAGTLALNITLYGTVQPPARRPGPVRLSLIVVRPRLTHRPCREVVTADPRPAAGREMAEFPEKCAPGSCELHGPSRGPLC